MTKLFSNFNAEFRLKENKTSWFLLLTAFLFVILRIPSLIEPNWYADEGIYQVVGRAIRNGEILYRDIWDNKPPLLYIIYAIFNGNLFYVKAASLIAGLLSIFSFYKLSTYVFKKTSARFISTFVFSLLFALPIIEGNIANAENFMLFPILLSAVFVFKYLENDKNKFLYFAGFLLSIALLIKIVAFFDFLAFLMFVIIQKKEILNFPKVKFRKSRPLIYFSVFFLSLMFISLLFFALVGAGSDFVSGVFSENVNYVNVSNDYFFPLGILFFKSIILLICLVLLYKKSKDLSRTEMFIYLWFAFSLYNGFFSQRPYIHYLLVILPSFSLLIGDLFETKRNRIFSLISIALTIFVVVYHFSIYKKTIAYYGNYTSFLTGKKTTEEYYKFFDNNTPTDYAIANFINESTSEEEPVLLWSNSAQIYSLTNKMPIEKYAVAYHITFYEGAAEETLRAIELKRPRFIIQTAYDQIMPKGMLLNYKLRYELDGAKIYEREI